MTDWLTLLYMVVQVVKDPLPVQETQETWVWSLGQEDPLEKGMETYSSILAQRILWTEEAMGLQRVGHDWATNTVTFKVRSHWSGGPKPQGLVSFWEEGKGIEPQVSKIMCTQESLATTSLTGS